MIAFVNRLSGESGVRTWTGAMLALGFMGLPGAAEASVTYQFEASSSFPQGNAQSMYSGGFTLTVADFITATTTIPVAAFSSCSVNQSNNQAAACDASVFNDAYYPGSDVLQFGFSSANASGLLNYYFDATAFGTIGTHDTMIFGADQQGRLIVSGSGSAVAEPAAWAMLIAGFGAVGTTMRRRRPVIHFGWSRA